MKFKLTTQIHKVSLFTSIHLQKYNNILIFIYNVQKLYGVKIKSDYMSEDSIYEYRMTEHITAIIHFKVTSDNFVPNVIISM